MAARVTVIIPAYNASEYIANAVHSALDQEDLPPDEIAVIIIDDKSPDREKLDEALRPFADDPQVTILHNETNMGAAESRNRAIDLAQSEYVAFLDADDWWEPDKLAAQLRLLDEQPQLPLCCSGRMLHAPDGTPVGRTIGVPDRISYDMLLRTNLIPCGSVVMRTSIAKEFHMTNAEFHEDYILWLRVLKKYGNAAAINEPLLHCRLSEGGKSRNKFKSARMQIGCYRVMGIGIFKSLYYFACYAVNGVKKYYT